MTDFTPHNAPAKSIPALPVANPGRPVGRDDLLKDIYNNLSAGKPVLLHGQEGSGRTTIGATLAAGYTQQAGGSLWLDASEDNLTHLLVQVGRAYDLTDITSSENPLSYIGSAASALMQNKPFIVIDNIKSGSAITPFVDKVIGSLPTLLLADEALEGNWTPMACDKLDDMSSVILFKQKSGIADSAQDIAIYGITKQLGYMPFPIALAARGMVASKQNADSYAKTIAEIAKNVGDDMTLATLATSYRALNQALQGLILMLGATYTGSASADMLAKISGVPVANIDQAMTILTQLYLVERYERYGEPHYRLHPAVHRFAQASLKGSNRLEPLEDKVHDSVLAYTKQYGASGSVNYNKLANALELIIATAKWAADKGNRDTANQLVVTLTQADDFIREGGFLFELLLLRAIGSGSTAAFSAYGTPETLVDDTDDFDEFDDDEFDNIDDDFDDDFDFDDDDDFDDDLNTLPPATQNLPTTTDALQRIDLDQLRIALAQAKEQKDVMRQVQTLKAIGKVQVAQNMQQEAIGTFTDVLKLYEETDDDEGSLEALDTLSSLLNKTGNTQAAVMHATRGIKLAREMDEQNSLMYLLIVLGDARQDLGESSEAINALTEALSITRNSGDKQNEAIILYKLGYAHLDDGDTDHAIQTWQDARELFKEQGKRDYEGKVLGGLGTANAEMGHWSEAIRYHKSALHIAREVSDKDEEAIQLSDLGQSQVEGGQLPDALLSYRQALHLAYVSDDNGKIINAAVDLVQLMMRSNRLLSICKLILDDGLTHSPYDRDALNLRDQLNDKLATAQAKGVTQAPVNGSAKDYASNAYQLLDG